MSHAKQNENIRSFVQKWTGQGYERGQSQSFWLDLLQQVLGVEHPSDIISFENQVKLSNTSFIDAYIARTKVLIERYYSAGGGLTHLSLYVLPNRKTHFPPSNFLCRSF